MGSLLSDNFARTAGLLVGLGAVAIALLSWQVSRPGTPGLDLTMVATPSVPLSVSPQTGFISASDMRPGTSRASAHGRVTVRNNGRGPAHLSLKAVGASPEVARVLQVSITSSGYVLYRGSMAGLRSWSTPRGLLPGGARHTLDVQLSLPDSARRGYQRRIEDLHLQFLATSAAPQA
jgi:hypothetical protein